VLVHRRAGLGAGCSRVVGGCSAGWGAQQDGGRMLCWVGGTAGWWGDALLGGGHSSMVGGCPALGDLT